MVDNSSKKGSFQDAIWKRLHENYDKHVEENDTQNIISWGVDEPEDIFSFIKKHNESSNWQNIKKYVVDVLLEKKWIEGLSVNDLNSIVNHLDEMIGYVENPISDALSFGEKTDSWLAWTTKALGAISISMQKYWILFKDFWLDVDFFKKYVKDWDHEDALHINSLVYSDNLRNLFLPAVYAYCETHNKSFSELWYPLEKDFDKNLKLNPAEIIDMNRDKNVSSLILSAIENYNEMIAWWNMQVDKVKEINSYFDILKKQKIKNTDDLFDYLIHNSLFSSVVFPEWINLKKQWIEEDFIIFYKKHSSLIENNDQLIRLTSLIWDIAENTDQEDIMLSILDIDNVVWNESLLRNKNITPKIKEQLLQKNIK